MRKPDRGEARASKIDPRGDRLFKGWAAMLPTRSRPPAFLTPQEGGPAEAPPKIWPKIWPGLSRDGQFCRVARRWRTGRPCGSVVCAMAPLTPILDTIRQI